MRTSTVSLIAVVLLACVQPVFATRQVRVYEVNVSSQAEPAVQAQSGMRQVLVRATGARDAANDPALAGVLSQAQQYVIATRPTTNSNTTLLVFDAAALERDITAAGRTVWSSERPLLLVILTGGPASGAFETRRQVEGALDNAANRRGQPIRVARPDAIGLPATGDIAPDAALAVAQRLGADAVVVGVGDGVPGGGPWRWTLTGPGISETWSGSLEDGVHAPADVFARNAVAFAGMPELTVLIEVEGVTGLDQYARTTDILSSAAGVRGVSLAEAAGTRATFSVSTRGGVDTLQSALGTNGHLERAEPKAGGTLAFTFRP